MKMTCYTIYGQVGETIAEVESMQLRDKTNFSKDVIIPSLPEIPEVPDGASNERHEEYERKVSDRYHMIIQMAIQMYELPPCYSLWVGNSYEIHMFSGDEFLKGYTIYAGDAYYMEMPSLDAIPEDDNFICKGLIVDMINDMENDEEFLTNEN